MAAKKKSRLGWLLAILAIALTVAVGVILWQTHEDQVGADYYDSLRGTAAETELTL